MVLLSSHSSVPALNPSPQWVTQVPFGNSLVSFGLSYLELDQLQKKLEKNGFRQEPVGTEKCDDGNTSNGDGCKGDGASQDVYRNVLRMIKKRRSHSFQPCWDLAEKKEEGKDDIWLEKSCISADQE